MAAPVALELVGVTKTFRDFWGRPRVNALSEVDLSLPAGHIAALLGRNGAGKSTLMHVCLGLLDPTAGRVIVLGGTPRDKEIRRRIGYLPEESSLHGFLTARETLRFHAGLCGLPADAAAARADYLLGLVDLTGDADRQVCEYSKGMARRLCLAQALVGDPELLFLDEPTSGLDPLGTRMVKDLLLKLKGLGRTVFLSSHLLGEVEEVADSIAILERGRVLCRGATAELLTSTRQEITTASLGEEQADRLHAFLTSEGIEAITVRRGKRSLEELFLATVPGGEGPCGPRSRSS